MSGGLPQKRSYHDTASTTTPSSSASTSAPTSAPASSSSTSDFLEFTPLGSGQEVGRSCHILRYKGKTIMLDCGIHPAYSGIACLPFFDAIDPSEIDIILITHFHLDHIAALPYFLQHTNFNGKCYMTHPTKSIYKLILQDYIKVTSLSVEDQLYSEDDLLQSMSKISTCNYHETVNYQGIKFVAYNAGHVLGAAMFMIEIGSVKILYTGDYSRKEDRHLMAAEIPDSKPDILVIEATYGVQTLQPIAERERRFTEVVRDIVSVRRGKVLLPAFALGRAQELLLILDEYWERHKQILSSIPIYFASSLAKKCMAVYQTYINMMNKRIQKQAQISNPFVFKHIRSLRGIEAYEETGLPCVIMASPGMLQNGLSRELLEMWCSDSRNGVVITGYAVEGTLAKQIMSEPEQITAMNGSKLPFKMSVNYISFSAHADYSETREFVDILRPAHVILVHGEANEGTGRLMEALTRRYSNDAGSAVHIVAPKNVQTVSLEFRAKIYASVVGKLGREFLHDHHIDTDAASTKRLLSPGANESIDGHRLSGLLVKKDFQYTIVSTDEISAFTPLTTTSVEQKLIIPYRQTWEVLKYFVGQMYEFASNEDHAMNPTETSSPSDNESSAISNATADDMNNVVKNESDASRENNEAENGANKDTEEGSTRTELQTSNINKQLQHTHLQPPTDGSSYIIVANCVMIVLIEERVSIELRWHSQPVSDMIADSIVAVIMNIENNPAAAKIIGVSKCNHHHGGVEDQIQSDSHQLDLSYFLREQYGDVKVRDDGTYAVHVDKVTAIVNPSTYEVECENQWLSNRIKRTLLRASSTLHPSKHDIDAREFQILKSS